jgi:hypothetical protein
MRYVKFDPGSTNVVEGELDKLGKLSKALGATPRAEPRQCDGAI